MSLDWELEYHPRAFALLPMAGASWEFNKEIVIGWFFWSVRIEFISDNE